VDAVVFAEVEFAGQGDAEGNAVEFEGVALADRGPGVLRGYGFGAAAGMARRGWRRWRQLGRRLGQLLFQCGEPLGKILHLVAQLGLAGLDLSGEFEEAKAEGFEARVELLEVGDDLGLERDWGGGDDTAFDRIGQVSGGHFLFLSIGRKRPWEAEGVGPPRVQKQKLCDPTKRGIW
jgi:hypothetical protein